MTIPLFTGPQDPSQLDNLLNQVIVGLNGFVTGTTPETVQVSAASTAAAIPNFGQFTLNSTTRTAGTTGRYTLSAPIRGQQVILTSLSTVKSTVTGVFERGKTKLSLISTATLAAGAKLPSVILTGLSTAGWGVSAGFGNVAST